MNMKRFLIMFLTSVIALGILILAAFFMKRESDEFDRRHPGLENPLESEAALLSTPESSSETAGTPSFGEESGSAAGHAGKNSAPASGEGPSGTADGTLSSPENTKETPMDASALMTETETPEQDRSLPDHQIIFVGDSRTIGMQNAINKLMPLDSCIFVGKVGEGCSWFLNEGMSQMGDAIAEYPDAPVVLNLGVNDPDQIEQYLAAYMDMTETFADTDFWFLSVNPVQPSKMAKNGISEEAMQLVTNTNITKLNEAIRAAYPDRYIDSSTVLKLGGFETVDGLHYTRQTYLKIHRYVAATLFD